MSGRKCETERVRRILLLFFVLLLLTLVVDTILKPCLVIETDEQRAYRIFCQEDSHQNAVRNSSEFYCNLIELSNGTNVSKAEEDWFKDISGKGKKRCLKHASCVLALMNQFIILSETHLPEAVLIAFFFSILGTLLFLPGSALAVTIGIGFSSALGLVNGVLIATIVVWIAVIVSSCLSYFVGRFLLRNKTQYFLEKYSFLRAIDTALGRNGLRIILLLRLSPLIPFAIFNYVAGCTCCRFRDYMIGTIIGVFPGTLAFVFIGAAIATAAGGVGMTDAHPNMLETFDCRKQGFDKILVSLLVFGICAFLLAIILIGRYARKALYQIEQESKHVGDDSTTPQIAAEELALS